MNGAIFFATKYRSTAEYARWISDATGLPNYNANEDNADPADFDFLVLGSAVIYYKLILKRWVQRHLSSIKGKPVILFTVSGAPAGEKLDEWIAASLPKDLFANVFHVALGGRQRPNDLTWFDWTMLKIAGYFNRDRKAAREERDGFDFVDKSAIAPIIEKIKALQADRNLQVATGN